jgi:peptidoglycan/LPS O-acetylase OafA/YrhL
MDKKIAELTNRGNNLLIVGLMSFLAVGVFAEIFLENELVDKADDVILVLLAIGGIAWYFSGQNRYRRSFAPYTLLAIVFIDKVAAFINEFNDPAASGDEFGIVPSLLVMVIVTAIILYRTRKVTRSVEAAAPQGEVMPSQDPEPCEGC